MKKLTSFGLELFAHVVPPLICQILVPARTHVQRRRIRVNQVCCPHAISGVVQAHSWPFQARHSAGVACTNVVAGEASCDVDLLLESQLRDKLSRAGVCTLPNAFASSWGWLSQLSAAACRYCQRVRGQERPLTRWVDVRRGCQLCGTCREHSCQENHEEKRA